MLPPTELRTPLAAHEPNRLPESQRIFVGHLGRIITGQKDMATPTTQQILAKIGGLEQYLNELNMIPATQRYRNAVILALLSKALTVSRAICTLIDAGFQRKHSECHAL